jgi:endoglucanase
MALAVAPGVVAGDHEESGKDLYVPKHQHGAVEQIADLVSSGDKQSAAKVKEMASTPQAFWVEVTDPAATMRQVRATVKHAAAKKQVPALVAYNIPFRDCAQFSAGGATSVAEYKAWIDGLAAGIGDLPAVVILEPDGLGIIPWYTTIDGVLEWCQPAEADPATAADDRFEMLNYAVDALKAQPNVSVYLDGTHSAWLNVGDITDRLVRAGVERADGFYLNASNYQYTANQVQYGTWISKCIAQGGDYTTCANQYWNGGPPGTMIADLLGPWTGVALSSFGEWSDTETDPALNTSGINARYWAEGETHFVIDTSRNGVGPWNPPAYPDPQDWCNPPGRGLGMTPTLDTGNELIDAYLWIKTPGESDGECTRGLGPAGETIDPEWGLIDPAAGDWFPEQVLDLITYADPPLEGGWPYKG